MTRSVAIAKRFGVVRPLLAFAFVVCGCSTGREIIGEEDAGRDGSGGASPSMDGSTGPFDTRIDGRDGAGVGGHGSGGSGFGGSAGSGGDAGTGSGGTGSGGVGSGGRAGSGGVAGSGGAKTGGTTGTIGVGGTVGTGGKATGGMAGGLGGSILIGGVPTLAYFDTGVQVLANDATSIYWTQGGTGVFRLAKQP